jgi:hypothetical protein
MMATLLIAGLPIVLGRQHRLLHKHIEAHACRGMRQAHMNNTS